MTGCLVLSKGIPVVKLVEGGRLSVHGSIRLTTNGLTCAVRLKLAAK